MKARTTVVLLSLLLVAGCVSEQKYQQEVQTAQTYQSMDKQAEALNRQLQAEIKADQVQIKQLQGRLVVTFVDEILFASGSAEMHAQGRSVIDKAVPTLFDPHRPLDRGARLHGQRADRTRAQGALSH